MEGSTKKLQYILVLFLIFTCYLFPQNEREIIQVDTVVRMDTVVKIIRVDTIVVTRIDTVMVGKGISETEVSKDFIKYNFYNDYLRSLSDTAIAKKEKKEGMSFVRAGLGPLALCLSIGADLPIYSKINITSKYIYCFFGDPGGGSGKRASLLMLGLGHIAYRKQNNNFILRLNAGMCTNPSHYVYPYEENKIALNFGFDIVFFKIFSISSEFFVSKKSFPQKYYLSAFPSISLGLNTVY